MVLVGFFLQKYTSMTIQFIQVGSKFLALSFHDDQFVPIKKSSNEDPKVGEDFTPQNNKNRQPMHG